jgi:hypothetical protein
MPKPELDERIEAFNEYRMCGSRYVDDAQLDWAGVWRRGGGPSKNEQHEAVKNVKQGQTDVRWEFRVVTIETTGAVPVTADTLVGEWSS